MDPKELYRTTINHFLEPVRHLLEDDSVTEVMINGHGTVFVERSGRLTVAEGCEFAGAGALMAAANNIAEFVGRRFDPDHHSMDGRLPEGYRVHIIQPPAARGGIHISIRKFARRHRSLVDLVKLGSLSRAAADFLGACVAGHKNLIISGGTSSGKTSMLNALAEFISPDERLIVIEDTSELSVGSRADGRHVVYLEAQPKRPDGGGEVTIRDLFVDSLRMRPDRIIVGEVRRGEALDLVQSMISGHSGALATVHASSPREALYRLEVLCMMAGITFPSAVARALVGMAVEVVLQVGRLGGVRRVLEIAETRGVDDRGQFRVRPIFRFHPSGVDQDGRVQGELRWTGKRPSFMTEMLIQGMPLGEAAFLGQPPAKPSGEPPGRS